MDRIKLNSSLTFGEAFNNFLFYKQSEGITDKTISSYKSHFNTMFKYIDPNKPLSELSQLDVQKMIVAMKEKQLRTNTIASYVRVMRVFLNWSRREGLIDFTIPPYKTEETIKELNIDVSSRLFVCKIYISSRFLPLP